MKGFAECGCVNPMICQDCKGTGYVPLGKVLASDLAIAAKKDEVLEIPGVNNLSPPDKKTARMFMM